LGTFAGEKLVIGWGRLRESLLLAVTTKRTPLLYTALMAEVQDKEAGPPRDRLMIEREARPLEVMSLIA